MDKPFFTLGALWSSAALHGRSGGPRVSPPASQRPMVYPPLSMDLGLLLVSIGVVNLWRARKSS